MLINRLFSGIVTPSRREVPPSSHGAASIRWGSLNATQRKLANFIVRLAAAPESVLPPAAGEEPAGEISWAQARGRGDLNTYRSLHQMGLIRVLPDPNAPEKVRAPLELRFQFAHLPCEEGTLASALSGYGEAALREMDARYRLALPAPCPVHRLRAAVYQAIIVAARAPENLPMTSEQRDILEFLLAGDECAFLGEVAEEFGSAIGEDSTACDEPDAWILRAKTLLPPDPLAELLAVGLVAADEDGFCFAPAELAPALRRRAALVPRVPAPAGPAGPPETIVSREPHLWLDLWRLTAAVACEPVPLTRSGVPTKAGLNKLAKRLGLEAQWLASYLGYLLRAELLELDTSNYSDWSLIASSAALADTRAGFDRLARDYGGFLRGCSGLDGAALRHYLDRCDRPGPLQGAVLAALAPGSGGPDPGLGGPDPGLGGADPGLGGAGRGEPGEGWLSLEMIVERVMNTRDRRVKSEVAVLSGYLSPRHVRASLLPRVRRELGFLFRYGAVEASPDLSLARPAPLLRHLLKGTPPPLPPPPAERLLLQPNLEALLPSLSSIESFKVLAAFGELKALDRMVIIGFSHESVHRGVERYGGLEALERELARAAVLPEAFRQLLEDVRARAGEITVMPRVCLVEVRKPHLARLLRAEAGAEPLDGAGRYFVVPLPEGGDGAAGLIRRLRKKGCFPLLREPPAGPASPASPASAGILKDSPGPSGPGAAGLRPARPAPARGREPG